MAFKATKTILDDSIQSDWTARRRHHDNIFPHMGLLHHRGTVDSSLLRKSFVAETEEQEEPVGFRKFLQRDNSIHGDQPQGTSRMDMYYRAEDNSSLDGTALSSQSKDTFNSRIDTNWNEKEKEDRKPGWRLRFLKNRSKRVHNNPIQPKRTFEQLIWHTAVLSSVTLSQSSESTLVEPLHPPESPKPMVMTSLFPWSPSFSDTSSDIDTESLSPASLMDSDTPSERSAWGSQGNDHINDSSSPMIHSFFSNDVNTQWSPLLPNNLLDGNLDTDTEAAEVNADAGTDVSNDSNPDTDTDVGSDNGSTKSHEGNFVVANMRHRLVRNKRLAELELSDTLLLLMSNRSHSECIGPIYGRNGLYTLW